jgi:uncharacterized protein involved in response to NO
LDGANLGWTPASIGIHALGNVGMGTPILGMMSRTARDHTGRLLQPRRCKVWAYRIALCGALTRVGEPLAGKSIVAVFAIAEILWSGAIVLILSTLTPWLLAPCLDNTAG